MKTDNLADTPFLPLLISERVYKKRQAAIDFARGSVRLEGFTLSPEVESINQQYARGEITSQERLAAVLRLNTTTDKLA